MAGRTRQPNPDPYPPGWEPFLAAIRADLDDDTPRLVFADWLQEHGDEARAEFIRLECSAARGAVEARTRADALFVANYQEWLRGFPDSVTDNPARCTFRRGFPAALTVTGDQFAADGTDVCRLAPVEELTIEPATPAALRSPALAGVRKLTLPQLTSAKVEALAASPALPTLTDLSVPEGDVSHRSVRELLANPALARLRRLAASRTPVGNAVAFAVADGPHLAGIEELDLGSSGFGATAAERLAGSPAAAGLRVLRIGGPVGDEGVGHLVRSPRLKRLIELRLRSCHLTPAALGLLAGWDGLRGVRTLDLGANHFHRADFDPILNSPHAAGLAELLY